LNWIASALQIGRDPVEGPSDSLQLGGVGGLGGGPGFIGDGDDGLAVVGQSRAIRRILT
jgi:hypothetical protein